MHKFLILGTRGEKMFGCLYDQCNRNGWDPGKSKKTNCCFVVDVPRGVTDTKDPQTLKFVCVPDKTMKPRRSWSTVFRKVEMLIYLMVESSKRQEDREEERMEFQSVANGEWFCETPILVVYRVSSVDNEMELLLKSNARVCLICMKENMFFDDISILLLQKIVDSLIIIEPPSHPTPTIMIPSSSRSLTKWIMSFDPVWSKKAPHSKSNNRYDYNTPLQNSVSLPSTKLTSSLLSLPGRKSQSTFEIVRNEESRSIGGI
jgi:hypothetical protein